MLRQKRTPGERADLDTFTQKRSEKFIFKLGLKFYALYFDGGCKIDSGEAPLYIDWQKNKN